MNFELGKEYIVTVTDKGIIPIEEFNRERFYDKDNDDLDFLTDEEKTIVVNELLDKIKTEIEHNSFKSIGGSSRYIFVNWVNQIIDKYKEI